MRSAILGKKLGMTSVFTDNGERVPCTVVEAGPCYVTLKREKERDGYEAIQIGYKEQRESKKKKPMDFFPINFQIRLLSQQNEPQTKLI